MTRVKQLMSEYGLEIDDIRFYLSFEMANTFLTFKDQPLLLADRIWSGSLSDELYDMEERFLATCEENLESRYEDEASLREKFMQAAAIKRKRDKELPSRSVRTDPGT